MLEPRLFGLGGFEAGLPHCPSIGRTGSLRFPGEKDEPMWQTQSREQGHSHHCG
jgi:hypothetical protein